MTAGGIQAEPMDPADVAWLHLDLPYRGALPRRMPGALPRSVSRRRPAGVRG